MSALVFGPATPEEKLSFKVASAALNRSPNLTQADRQFLREQERKFETLATSPPTKKLRS